MDKWFFDNDDNLRKLEADMAAWRGTPYKHWTGVQGRGCDCIHFIVRILEPLGAFGGRRIVIPKYPRDWHLHRKQALLVDGIRKQMPVEEVDREKPCNGDVILYQYGFHESHGGIYYNGKVVQALNEIGVTERDYTDPYFFERMKRCFRIKAIR